MGTSRLEGQKEQRERNRERNRENEREFDSIEFPKDASPGGEGWLYTYQALVPIFGLHLN